MRRMIFISRHKPTGEQTKLATYHGFELIHVGDVDAFDAEAVLALIRANNPEKDAAICCVHPAVALTAIQGGVTIGLFENAQRVEEGKAPTFHAKALHMYEVSGMDAASGGYALCYCTKASSLLRWHVYDNGSGFFEVVDLGPDNMVVPHDGWGYPTLAGACAAADEKNKAAAKAAAE